MNDFDFEEAHARLCALEDGDGSITVSLFHGTVTHSGSGRSWGERYTSLTVVVKARNGAYRIGGIRIDKAASDEDVRVRSMSYTVHFDNPDVRRAIEAVWSELDRQAQR